MAVSKKQKFHKIIAATHKWVGLLIAVQILFWTLGGVVMSWIPLEEVRGEHKVAEKTVTPITAATALMPVASLQQQSGKPIVELRYETLLGETVAKLRYEDGQREIRNAISGEILTPIDATLAQKIAEADYKPAYTVKNVVKLDKHNIDYRGPLPVWQVNFSDGDETALYVSPIQARVVARRSSTWRFYDFFWMLHIMDYDERHDTNNLLLIIFSAAASLFVVSGIILLFFRFYRRDFNFLLGRKKKAT